MHWWIHREPSEEVSQYRRLEESGDRRGRGGQKGVMMWCIRPGWGGGISSGAYWIPIPFLGLIHHPRATWICASNWAGSDLSCPIATAGVYPGAKGQMSSYHKESSSQSSPARCSRNCASAIALPHWKLDRIRPLRCRALSHPRKPNLGADCLAPRMSPHGNGEP